MITALLFSAISALSPAAQPVDDGWLAWYGCWRAEQDAPANMLCIVPTTAGARLLSIENGKVIQQTELVADGVDRPVAQEGCSGTEHASWSQDHQRLFVASRMQCGTNLQRKLTGIMAMRTSSSWINVQSVSSSGSPPVARVLRYKEVNEGVPADIAAMLAGNKLARVTARYAAIGLLELDDVQEALRATDEQAVTEWLTETRQAFDLTGRKLVALADAGVPANVIDVLVAVSHPEALAVRTDRERERERVYDYGRRDRAYSSCYDPWYDPWYGSLGYSYGYGRCYGYYGYGRYGSLWGYDPYGWYISRTPVIIYRDGGGIPGEPAARATRRGYTNGRSDSGASSRDTDSASRPSSSGSSGGSSTSGSSGGSGSSTGRTAKPRGS